MTTRSPGPFCIQTQHCHRTPDAYINNMNIPLTHWGRATHICVGKLTTIGSDNGLSPGRRQAIIWTIDGILLIGYLGTNFSEILIAILSFSFKKMHLKMSSAKMAAILSRGRWVKKAISSLSYPADLGEVLSMIVFVISCRWTAVHVKVFC